MKYTLLQMVQRIAAKLGGDEISTLDETIEAVDIKNEVLNTFDDLISIQEWEWLKHIPRQLDARTVDPAQPACVLNIPADVLHIESLMYEVQSVVGERATCKKLTYLAPAAFQQMVMSRGIGDNIDELTVNEIPWRIYNNRNPSYFTTFDERVVVFDGYDSAIDTTGIDYSKTSCITRITISSDDIDGSQSGSTGGGGEGLQDASATYQYDNGVNRSPPLPDWFYNLWYHEATARCFSSIRGVEDGRTERMARRAMTTAIRMDNVGAPNYVDDGVNYGR